MEAISLGAFVLAIALICAAMVIGSLMAVAFWFAYLVVLIVGWAVVGIKKSLT